MTASTRTATADALLAGFDADLYVTDPDIITSYARDRTGAYVGIPLAVARPRSAQELSAIMIRCAELGVGVVPQGGLTGLVGAAVSDPDQPELVVLLDRMNAIRLIDTVGFAMVVEAGCVLETAKQAAEEQDCLLPITFGAQGSCRIGGNVATNAGGFNVLRYGMTRDLVLGLEVVLPDGRIWNGLRTLRKDNRGYDLKQLFIGAEGTLGIVTAVALKLFPKPTQVETALVGLQTVEDAMALYAMARRSCSDLLSAFEIMLRPGLERGLAHRPELTDPLETPCPVYILMELAGGGGVDLRALLENCLADAGELLMDGVIAMSKAQTERLWSCREAMVEAQSRSGPSTGPTYRYRSPKFRPFLLQRWRPWRSPCPRDSRLPTAMSETATSTSISCLRRTGPLKNGKRCLRGPRNLSSRRSIVSMAASVPNTGSAGRRRGHFYNASIR